MIEAAQGISRTWTWEDVDPATRGVAATFSGRFWGKGPNDLNWDQYVEAIAPFDVSEEDFIHGGRTGLDRHMAARMALEGPVDCRPILLSMVALSGNVPEAWAASDEAKDRLLGADGRYCYDAIAPLETLSRLALRHLVPPVG